jgi:hypothetical protein
MKMVDAAPGEPTSDGTGAPQRRVAGPSGIIASELGGDLPCVRCRYNLKGLSIRGVCPECATPVRATLLAVVDPMAGELRPIFSPRATAIGVLVWGLAPLLAALCVWGMKLVEVVPVDSTWNGLRGSLAIMVVLLTGVSGMGAVALVKPHGGLKRKHRRMAMAAVALYLPLSVVLWWIHGSMVEVGFGAYGEAGLHRIQLRLLAGGLMMLIIVGLRPNARVLAARSLLMRSGRVDRQTMLALVAVLGLSMFGDVMMLIAGEIHGPIGDTVREVGKLMVLAGSLLFTIGLAGVALDCWRLRSVLAEAPLSLGQLLTTDPRYRADSTFIGPGPSPEPNR